MESPMMTLSLDETFHLLNRYKHVVFDEDVSNMKVSINDEGLIISLRNKRETSVMLFPRQNNEYVRVSKTTVSLFDGCMWLHEFSPLVNTVLV